MRPANLIPQEERRQRGQGFRSAPLAYLLVGFLLLALGGVTLTVVTDNQIADRKHEVAEAKVRTAAAEAKADRLAAYTQYHAIATQRVETISNLANSRFDWVKVMRQLAEIKPDDVYLTNLTGTVRPDISVAGGESVALRASISGPALSLAGCGTSQEAVAGFIAALKDIEGVTRVGVQSSGRSGGDGGGSSSSAECGGFQFQMVIAFDAAPIPTPIAGGEGVIETPAPEEPAPEGEESTETSEEAAPEGE